MKKGITGSIGSHWERTIIQNEVMTASITFEGNILTIFTVSLLKDTGFWNDVNENFTNQIYWGRNKGCDFVTLACKSP